MIMRRFLHRFANLFGSRAEREMQREIDAHLALIEEDFVRQGVSPDEARRAARRTYGGIEQSKELHREARSFTWLYELGRDIAYGLRTLRQHPAFALSTLAVLALGIGLTTAVFSIVDAVLLKPLPVPGAERLVALGIETPGMWAVASPAMYDFWSKQTDIFEGIAAFPNGPVMENYSGGNVAEQWQSIHVNRTFFDLVSFPLIMGRTFTEEEDSPTGPNVVLLDETLWRRRFDADPDILGKTISLNEREHTIVGVVTTTPILKEIANDPIQVYTSLRLPKNTSDQSLYFNAIARLREGVTLEQAKQRLAASTTAYLEQYKWTFDPGTHFSAAPIREVFVSDLRSLILLLFGAVCFVLLIACTNVANLMLVRSTARRREIGIRLATGASRSRIVRQLITESLLLAVCGGIVGLWLGHTSLKLLLAAYDPNFMRLGEQGGALSLDWRIAAFTLTISVVAGLLFGVWPAFQSSRVDLNSVIKDNGGRTATGLRHNKSRSLLVICEVGLAVVLLVGSALLIRAFAALYQVERGFMTANVLVMRTILTGDRHTSTAGVTNTADTGLAGVRSLPGIAAVSASCCIPLDNRLAVMVEVPGVTQSYPAGWTPITPGYFDVFRIPIQQGRAIDARDRANSPPVAVVNESFARDFLKGRDPLSERVLVTRGTISELDKDPPRQIVGVVADMRDRGLQDRPIPTVFLPQAQLPNAYIASRFHDRPMAWTIRTRADSKLPVSTIRERLRQATGLPVSEPQTMDQIVALSTARERFSAILMGVFGCGALILAAIGVYGLMAYTVEQRTQEIGIRMALGADAVRLRNKILRQGMLLAIIGTAAGLAGAWGLAQTLEAFLFSVTAHDATVFTAVPALMLFISLLAVWIPTRRAMKVNPVEALRCD